MSGLLIAALFAAAMSSMDSGISCVSTVVIHDFLKPLRLAPRTEAGELRLARGLVLLLGVFATAVAFWAARFEQLIEAYTQIVSLFNAPVLGLFLLGLLPRRATFRGGLVGTALAIPATQWLSTTPVHYAWRFPFSLAVTFAAGYAASLLLPRPRAPRAAR